MAAAIAQHRARGFTLIELLVVLAIIALVAGFVALNAPQGSNEARDAADAFAAKLSMASTQSIMTGTAIGLEISTEDYAFYAYGRGEWAPLNDGRLIGGTFPADLAVEADAAAIFGNEDRAPQRNSDEEKNKPAPIVLFGPTGETTPLRVAFSQGRDTWFVTMDSGGEIDIVSSAQ